MAEPGHWCSDRSSDGEGSFSDENRTLQIRLLLRAKRTKSAQKRTFPLQENFYLKRSEIFGPNSEKHFRKDGVGGGLLEATPALNRHEASLTKKIAAKTRITIPDHP